MPEQKPPTGMKPTTKAAAWVTICCSLVGGFEGLRTVAYSDPVGIPTICFGETAGVKLGDTKTADECKGMLTAQVQAFNMMLERASCVGKEQMDALNPKTKAAVVSLMYNVGPGKYGVKDGVCQLKNERRASTLAIHLRNGRVFEACQQFKYWANPSYLRGLAIRRDGEGKLCMEGYREGEFSTSYERVDIGGK